MKPVGYKLVPPPTQLLLADQDLFRRSEHFLLSTMFGSPSTRKRAMGCRSLPISESRRGGWRAGYGGSRDNVENEDVVVWSVFGLTHNPRVEDWPVM